MTCRQQVVGAAKVLAILIIPSVTALWGIGWGEIQHEKAILAKCRSALPFRIEGEQLLCLNAEGLTHLFNAFAADLKKKGTTPS